MADIKHSQLQNIDTGILKKDACVVIVRTDWNAEIVGELESGCRRSLAEYGVTDVRLVTVPGAFEISFAIKKFWEINKYKDNRPDAFIALGCVLRGDTPHFEFVCQSVTNGITQLNLDLPVPTIFGVLTIDTVQQAKERLGGSHGHKGEEAALTAIKMISLVRSFNNNR